MLVGGVKHFIQSGFTVWRARREAERRRGHRPEEGARGGEERSVALERELASVRAAAKMEDAAAALKTRAASETPDRSLKECRAERCEESLAPKEKACVPPGILLEEWCPLLRLRDGLSARPALLFPTENAAPTRASSAMSEQREGSLQTPLEPAEPGKGSLTS